MYQNRDTCYKCLIIDHFWVAVGLFTLLQLNQTVVVNPCIYFSIFHLDYRNSRIVANFEVELISQHLKISKYDNSHGLYSDNSNCVKLELTKCSIISVRNLKEYMETWKHACCPRTLDSVLN